MQHEIVVSARDLSKTYQFHRKEGGLGGSVRALFRRQHETTRAVQSVSFDIGRGEVVGFLGPNGAGKTTTLKMLSGLLHPSQGVASVLGFTPFRRNHSFLQRIALVMGQKSMLRWDLPAIDTLLLRKVIYDVPDEAFTERVEQLTKLLDVSEQLKVQVRKLSLGQRMKFELIAALIHDPEIMFLDEPTIGLDVVSQQQLREFLRTINHQRGTTILLTSHYMEDIEELCPRVLLIDHGTLHFDGPLEDLVSRAAPRRVIRATFSDNPSAALPSWPEGVEALEGTDHTLGNVVALLVPRLSVTAVVSQLLAIGAVDLTVEEPPVEEVIRKIFAGEAHL